MHARACLSYLFIVRTYSYRYPILDSSSIDLCIYAYDHEALAHAQAEISIDRDRSISTIKLEGVRARYSKNIQLPAHAATRAYGHAWRDL